LWTICKISVQRYIFFVYVAQKLVTKNTFFITFNIFYVVFGTKLKEKAYLCTVKTLLQ